MEENDDVPHSQAKATEVNQLLELFRQAPGWVAFLRGRTFVFELANDAYDQLVGHRDILGKTVRDALPEVEGQGYFELLEKVFDSGEPFIGRGMRADVQRSPGAPLTGVFIDFIYHPSAGRTATSWASSLREATLPTGSKQRRSASDSSRARLRRARKQRMHPAYVTSFSRRSVMS